MYGGPLRANTEQGACTGSWPGLRSLTLPFGRSGARLCRRPASNHKHWPAAQRFCSGRIRHEAELLFDPRPDPDAKP